MTLPERLSRCCSDIKVFRSFGCSLAVVLLLLCVIGSGCSTPEMKGTPFYTGEYGRSRGPAEQRLNAWPLLYYREPALSVLWPILEFTDDHWAVRPLMSVYGLDQTNREYSFLWPLAQVHTQTSDGYVFPVFWGDDHFDVFPLYWHIDHPSRPEGGTDALFPLWIYTRHTNEFRLWSPWPLVHYWDDRWTGERGSMVLPFYWRERDLQGSRFFSLLWLSGSSTNGEHWRLLSPLYYEVSNQTHSAWVTPLWAKGHSASNDWQAIIPFAYWDKEQRTLVSPLWANWRTGERETSLAPWLLSWKNRARERSDLWLAGGIAHASWGAHPGSHYVLPFYYRDALNQTLLTPLCGWNEKAGYVYPFTPLFGLLNQKQTGSWLFPLYSHSRNNSNGAIADTFLLAGGRTVTGPSRHTWLYPLFSFHDYGPLETELKPGERYGQFGTKFWCFPFSWHENLCTIHPANERTFSTAISTNAPLVRTYSRRTGAFPFWTYRTSDTPAQGRKEITGSSLIFLYDYKHEIKPQEKTKIGSTNDYTRARVCWRLWHYERLNGDVSLDIFPAFTYDHKTDGFKKTSFLWRFFRYEQSADSHERLDLLFIPVRR